MKRIRIEEIDGTIYIDGMDVIKTIGEISKEADRLKAELNKQKEVIDKAIDKLYTWGETLNSTFQKEMLDILKEVSK